MAQDNRITGLIAERNVTGDGMINPGTFEQVFIVWFDRDDEGEMRRVKFFNKDLQLRGLLK